jgi:hypothetical protein
MKFSLAPLITKAYWFAEPTSFNRDTLIVYGVMLAVLFLLGIVCKVMSGKETLHGIIRGVYRRAGTWALTGSLVGAVILFWRYEYVPLLSYRFWFGLWILILLIWAVVLVVRSLERVRRMKEQKPTV